MEVRKYSLTKLLVFLLAWALLPTLVALSLLQYQDYVMSYGAEVEASLRAARRVADSFSTFVDVTAAYETGIGNLTPSNNAGFDRNRYLAQARTGFPAVAALHWLDPDGTVLFSSDRAAIGAQPLDKEWLPAPEDTPQTRVCDLLPELGPNREPAFAVITHIGNAGRLPGGYLVVVVDPLRLFHEALLAPDRPAYVTVLIDSQGRLAAEFPDGEPLTWEQRDMSRDVLVSEALAGSEGQREFRSPATGKKLLESRVHIGQTGWVAGVNVDLAKALAPARFRYMLSMLLSTLVFLGSAGAAVYLSRRISRNVRNLRRHAKALERGVSEAGREPADIAEFAEVSAAFDEMAVTLKRGEEALKGLAADLARSNRDLEQFAYMASHDLQEPVRMIKGFGELLVKKHGDKLDEEGREYLSYVLDGASRMEVLIRGLLALSRSDRQPIEPEPVDLNATVESVLLDLSGQVESSGARVTTQPLPTVRGSETLLYQVYQNLLSNAIKFRAPERPLEIVLGARKEGANWLMWVRDNGIGFPPESGERLFDVFQRLHPEEKREGAGIGLAICKRLVERHGGRIWAESEPGSGATFYFTLPAQPG